MKDIKKYYIGVDISKVSLNICLLQKTDLKEKTEYFKILNDESSIKAFFGSLKFCEFVVAFESTNNYSVPLQKYLSKNKIIYKELNPLKFSHFLKALSHNKTDIIDSYGIAFYCYMFSNTFIQAKFNPKFKLLKSYLATHKILTKIQTQLKNFDKSQNLVNDEILQEIIKNIKDYVDLDLKKLDNLAFELLKLEIPQTQKIINENKGIGRNLALSLFPILEYNKDKNAKQIISYIGLAPKFYESGTSIHKKIKISKNGSSDIRKSLFLSALSCVRFNPIFKARYENLINNGKNKKVALIAVCCAIVRYLKAYYFSDEIKENID